MTYRVICQYLPDAAVYAVGRPGRGAWRIVACFRPRSAPYRDHPPVQIFDAGRDGRLLVVNSHRHRQPNSWCSPRKIVAQWQAEQRGAGYHAYNPDLWTERGCERGPLVRPWA